MHTKGIYIAVLNEGTIRTELATVLMRWQKESPFSILIDFAAEKPIENNRNQIVKKFLARPEYEWLLQIDDDIIPPNDYLDLALHDKDIISGVCFAMRQNAIVPLMLEDESEHMVFKEEEDINKLFNAKRVNRLEGLIEVDAVGTGAILIHRRVFENPEMQKHPFITIWNEDGTRKIGQDLGFCRKAKANGFKIWVDTRYICEHAVDCVGLSKFYETMTKLAVAGGDLDDDFYMRRFDNAKPMRAADEMVLPIKSRKKLKTKWSLMTHKHNQGLSKTAKPSQDLEKQESAETPTN